MSVPLGALDLTSLGMGLVGVAISLAGIMLLRPSVTPAAGRERRADADTDRTHE